MNQESNTTDWAKVYRENRKGFFVFAMAITGEPGLAEDAIHDAFVKLTIKMPTCRNAKTFAYQCVRNAAIEVLRRRRRIGEPGSATDLEYAADRICSKEPGTTSLFIEMNESESAVADVLNRLDALTKEIIMLHIHSNLLFREIASVLEMPQGTVATRYRRGIEKMRQVLNPQIPKGERNG